MHFPPPPDSLMKKMTKFPRVKNQTAPPPRVDPDEKSKNREKKLPSPNYTIPPSEETREKNTKTLKGPVRQHRRIHS